jgi:DNA primase
VFPVRGRGGELVAAQGRRIEATAKGTPNALTTGPKSRGAFLAPAHIGGRKFGPLDPRGPGVIVCEAPIDALSLAACGFPALALCGINGAATTGPAWLPLVCGLKAVYLAFDADDAGDSAAGALAARLGVYGARCDRLRPEGAKDWNEALQARGRDALSDWMAARVLA